MELRTGNVSWLDFLLNRSLLPQYLNNPDAEPSPLMLLSQFLVNMEKCADAALFSSNDAGSNGMDISSGPETILKASRMQKYRTLRLMTIQTAAHLSWDLDILCKLPLPLQNSLMNFVFAMGQDPKGNNQFLQCLYHRWALRTLQTNKFSRPNANNCRPGIPMIPLCDPLQHADAIAKSLNSDKALEFLENVLKDLDLKSKVLIPNLETFAGSEPNWSVGTDIDAELFASMLHIDLGIFLLYEGSREEAADHLKSQKIPTEDFPYMKISQKRLEGFLAAVGVIDIGERENAKQVKTPALDHSRTVEIARLLLENDYKKILSMFPCDDVDLMDDDEEDLRPLDPSKIPRDPDDQLVGREQIEMYNCERVLLETADFNSVKELVIRLSQLNRGCSVVPKLFSEWELPVPIQHATEKIPVAALKDFVHVLVAKSKQHLNLENYAQARNAILMAKTELEDSLRTPTPWVFGQFNVRKLSQMLEWEILLIDIAEMIADWTPASGKNHVKIIERCKECLRFLEDPSAEVNPRSEIIEFVLIALINLGEFKVVTKFEESQKRWPFVEFLGLLARVCRDISEKKDVSSHYRELWQAVLPVCMNSMGVKIQRVLGKEGILSNRSSLAWVLDRCCSHTLITVFVSLLSRLHNHILDDVALQIHTEFLHVWPNIIDDVTTGSPLDMKSRVSGVKNLNVRQIQDFLLHLLQLALIRSEETLWLKCQGDVYLASGSPALAMKSYVEHLAITTDFFEKHSSPYWNDNALVRKMIKCCETLQCFTQAIILCQFLTDVDYTTAFGMAQEKVTLDGSDSLYGFIWDLTILEFVQNLHTKRNEHKKRQEVVRLLGMLELNANNNEEIQREAMYLRKSQFMRTLAKMYVFV